MRPTRDTNRRALNGRKDGFTKRQGSAPQHGKQSEHSQYTSYTTAFTSMKPLPCSCSAQRCWASTPGLPQLESQTSTSAVGAGGRHKPWRHTLLFCPTHAVSRARFFHRTGIADLQTALSTPASAHQAARWLVASGLLTQFELAQQITQENTAGYAHRQRLSEWEGVQ